MNVHWTDTAEGHLDAIYAYVAQDSPEYARRMVDRLTRRSQQIAKFPFSCRRVPEYDVEQIREVIEGPFRIIYHIKSSDQIDVLAVIHGAMDLLGISEQENE
jgi:toxin ParE1/3/4